MLAFHYGFTPEMVSELTRRQLVGMIEHLNTQRMNDARFEARLHGMKINEPAKIERWSSEADKKLSELAKRRFEEMKGAL